MIAFTAVPAKAFGCAAPFPQRYARVAVLAPALRGNPSR